MKFYDKRHLVTGSEDNMICIVKATGSWNVEKTLAKHQGAVTDLAVHPSGKMMLSIGEDNKLITWNLIKGRSVALIPGISVGFFANLIHSILDIVISLHQRG